MTDHTHVTPISQAYDTCEWTHAALNIYSNRLKREELSAFLDITPTKPRKAIKQIENNSKSISKPRWLGVWSLSSEEIVKSKDLRDHLDWLFSMLMPKQSSLLKLQKLDDIKMTVTCVWWSKHGGGGPALWPEQMNLFYQLNLECSFSFAYYGDEAMPLLPSVV